MTTKERSILSEFSVARDRACRLRETLLAHRLRTPFAEVDLLMSRPHGLVVIEVKTVTEAWDPSFLSSRQSARLQNARAYFEEKSNRSVSLLLALVSLEARTIRYVEDGVDRIYS